MPLRRRTQAAYKKCVRMLEFVAKESNAILLSLLSPSLSLLPFLLLCVLSVPASSFVQIFAFSVEISQDFPSVNSDYNSLTCSDFGYSITTPIRNSILIPYVSLSKIETEMLREHSEV